MYYRYIHTYIHTRFSYLTDSKITKPKLNLKIDFLKMPNPKPNQSVWLTEILYQFFSLVWFFAFVWPPLPMLSFLLAHYLPY